MAKRTLTPEQKERKNELRRVQRGENPGQANAYNRNWCAENPEQYKASKTKWLAENPEKAKQYKTKYNHRVRRLPKPTRPCPELCECCGGPPNGTGKLHLDHCHVTGLFRGWLCMRCNVGLGGFGDTLMGVKMAVKYLEMFELESLGTNVHHFDIRPAEGLTGTK